MIFSKRSLEKIGRNRFIQAWLIVFISIAIYFFTAPFVIPSVHHSQLGRIFYRPIILSLEKDWFGRDFVWEYCFELCHMKMLLAIEVGPEDIE